MDHVLSGEINWGEFQSDWKIYWQGEMVDGYQFE